MSGFLFPMAAWLGLLALPVIGFYLLKTRQRRKPVPTLLFWNVLAPRVERTPFWRKLRRWVSLAIQLLILALIIAALARPAFDWERREPRHLVAVLDPSASMTAREGRAAHWETSREALLRSIARLRPEDEMTLLSAANPPAILQGWASSRRALREAVEAARPLPTGSDPRPALELAGELALLRERAEIVVFSDAVWPGAVEAEWPKGVRLHSSRTEKPRNTGITHFSVRRSPIAPGDWQLDVEVTSANGFEGRLELQRDGQPLDLAELTLEPQGRWQRSWRGNAEAGALFSANLRMSEEDQLISDNHAAARLPALKPLRVLIVGPVDGYLEALLDSIPLVQRTRLEHYPAVLPEEVDLVIARGDQLPDAPPPETALLLIAPQRSGFWGEQTGRLAEAPVSEQQKSARLLQHVQFGPVAIREAAQWQPAPGSETLVASMDHPLVFGQWDRSPRWLVLGFDPSQSDFPLRTAFPVLMGNLLESLRPDDPSGEGTALLPGNVESRLVSLPVEAESESQSTGGWPVLPGWWCLVALALAGVTLEWGSFNRRMTD